MPRGWGGLLIHQATGNLKFGSGKPKVNPASYILLAVGLFFFIAGLFLDRLTVLPIIGVIFCLFWAILFSRANRVRLSIYYNDILIQWKDVKTEKTAKASLATVMRYSFFCLLPIYLMWTLPAFMCGIGGAVGWLSIGAIFWVISAVVFWGFADVWKNLGLKRRWYWLMNLGVWLVINVSGWVLFFMNKGVR